MPKRLEDLSKQITSRTLAADEDLVMRHRCVRVIRIRGRVREAKLKIRIVRLEQNYGNASRIVSSIRIQ